MQHALLYAKSFALLLEEVQSASDMTMVRSSLLRVRRFSRSHGLTLALADEKLSVNGLQLPKPIAALHRLSLTMQHHGVAKLTLSAGAVPRELLKLAVMLSSPRSKDPNAPTIFEELRDASLWSVQASPERRTSSPDASTEAAAPGGDAQSGEQSRAVATIGSAPEAAGEAAAQKLIEQLSTSDSVAVRRACFDALAEMRLGTPQLLTLLDHQQWYVVRNAVCLLGAFRSKSSEPELTAALGHSDERVRAAVVTSLLQLDTPSSRATVCGAIRDESAEVRRRAVRGFLVDHGSPANVDKLLQALERETELDVQIEFLYALGTLATPDAVQRLIRLCSIENSNRPTDFRIAAAEALASARLGAAVPMLRMMLNDPDMHARAAARHLIRAVS
jgi:HEAT repeat protein